MASYWQKRHDRAKQKLTDKGIDKINKQLKKYYQTCMNSVIKDFESTYDKLLAAKKDDKQPTPADLYKLDKYWQAVAQCKNELQKLGDKQADLLSKEFTNQYMSIYEASALDSGPSFSKIDKSLANQMINQIWCADGKTWSQRIWGNINRLQETLNEGLISCVVTGKKTTELKRLLQERFGVSYRRANTLVRTEMSNISNQAAKQRYLDSGITKYEFLGREERSGCGHSPDCHKLDGKKFLLAEMKPGENAPPMHPNCRCSIVPVVFEDKEEIMEEEVKNEEVKHCALCGKEFTKRNAKAHNQKYCDECSEHMQWERTPEGRRLNRRLDKGMDFDEAWDEVFESKPKKKGREVAYNDYQALYRSTDNPSEKRKINRWYNEGVLWKYEGKCEECGKPFIKKSNSSKYCEECKVKRRKAQKKASRNRNKKK